MNTADFAGGSKCGQSVTISWNGKTQHATVADEVSLLLLPTIQSSDKSIIVSARLVLLAESTSPKTFSPHSQIKA